MKEKIVKFLTANTLADGTQNATTAAIAAGIGETPEATWMVLESLLSEGRAVFVSTGTAERIGGEWYNVTEANQPEPEEE